MNIMQKLDEKGTVVNLIYYGPNDMASGFQIKTLIDNEDIIVDYFENKNIGEFDFDCYVDYIFLNTHIKLQEIISIVRIDLQDKLRYIIVKLEKYILNYKTRDINKYIKQKYSDLLNRENIGDSKKAFYDIIEYTLNYINENFKSFCECEELYKYIIQEYAYKVFYEFEDYKKMLEKYPYLYKHLLSKKVIEGQMSRKVESFTNVLSYIKKQKDLKIVYNQSIELITQMVRKRSFNTDIDRVIYTYNDVKECLRLLKKLENKKAKEFEVEMQNQEKMLSEYLHKKGQKTKFEIDIKEFIKIYEDTNLSWEIKALMITHTKEGKEISSRIKHAIEKLPRSQIMDLVSTNIDTNKYFTYSVQNNLRITMMFGKLIINYMITSDDRLKELLNYIYAGVGNYIEKNNIENLDLEDDFNILSYGLYNLKENKSIEVNFYSYSICNIIIGILEKILRGIYTNTVVANQYVPYSRLTLDNLLKTTEIENLIGQANARTIRFYLTSYDNVGKNIRNDLGHYNDNIRDVCTYENILLLMYLLITVTNELLLKIIRDNEV